MNEREELLAALRYARVPNGPWGSEEDGLIDAYAHRLAEKIRDAALKTRMASDRPALWYAADLIDPEVEK